MKVELTEFQVKTLLSIIADINDTQERIDDLIVANVFLSKKAFNSLKTITNKLKQYKDERQFQSC